jgi:hypothetical protein
LIMPTRPRRRSAQHRVASGGCTLLIRAETNATEAVEMYRRPFHPKLGRALMDLAGVYFSRYSSHPEYNGLIHNKPTGPQHGLDGDRAAPSSSTHGTTHKQPLRSNSQVCTQAHKTRMSTMRIVCTIFHLSMSWAPSRRLTLWLRGLRGY